MPFGPGLYFAECGGKADTFASPAPSPALCFLGGSTWSAATAAPGKRARTVNDRFTDTSHFHRVFRCFVLPATPAKRQLSTYTVLVVVLD